MLKMVNPKRRLFALINFLCFISIISINSTSSTSLSSSSSEVLIIRHGRSRVRHSNEKDHIRWGLKAFDNLTLDYIDNYYENGTQELGNESGGLAANSNLASNIGGNSTSSETITIKINQTIDYDTTIDNFNPYMNGKSNLQSQLLNNWNNAAANGNSISKNKKSKLGKKEIMENIRKTVDKGIEYLKAHPNLDEIKIEIKDLRDNQANYDDNLVINNKELNHDFNFIVTSTSTITSLPVTTASTTTTTQRIPTSTTNQPPSSPLPTSPTVVPEFPSNPANSNDNDYLIFSLKPNQELFNSSMKLSEDYQNDEANYEVLNSTKIRTESPDVSPKRKKPKKTEHSRAKNNAENSKRLIAQDDRAVPDKEMHENKDKGRMIMNKNDGDDDEKYDNKYKNKNDDDDENEKGNVNDNSTNTDSHSNELMNDNNIEMNDELINLTSDSGIDDEDEDSNSNDGIVSLEDILGDNGEDTGVDDNIHRLDDINIDLSDLDETSKNNRKNLIRGRDVVTQFLQIVESQHLLGANCTAGTALNLGEGVVDRYAQDRFRVEAEVAVNRANMLTRIFKFTSTSVQASEHLLHASVLSMIEFDDDIFAAGNCFDWNQHPTQKGLFCPFAYRLPPPDQGAALAKDLAAEYHYLGNTSEWFFLARKNAEKVIARNEQYIKSYHLYSNSSTRQADEILSVKYEDGRWSKPYYDCGGGNIWMLTYTVPFFGYENGTYFFKGTSGIDIDLRRVDIDQCPQRNSPTGVALPLNIFAGTDKCKQRTTECLPIPGVGFRRGSYKCVCRKGFYFPDTNVYQKYFNGSTLEEEYEKMMSNEFSLYNNDVSYQCLPCAEGCDFCEDASPCVAELNWPMRTSILGLACIFIGFLPPAALFTFRYQQVKVVRAASPALLRVIALGAFFIYCTSIVLYPPPSIYLCTARIWLREIGFSLTYGALMLKTWRISVIFRVRSAKAVKITDASLLKRLGVLCGFVGVFLLVRTLVAPPVVIVGRTADNLKAFLCKTDWWDHTFTSMEVLFLAWGVRLCIMVRKAPSEFNESRFISMAIYNEFLLTCFLNVSMLFLQSPANPDLLYIIFFCHTQLTVTLLLCLIFGSKVYLVFRGGGKPHDDSVGMGIKSSGTKFIHRSQARTFANASSVTTSTAQIGGNQDARLTDQEAMEEIKQLSQQLQRLYERIPSRGSAISTISALLDICRGSSNPTSLKPPALPAICSKPAIKYLDKSTNTNTLTNSNEQMNGINTAKTRITITDESIKIIENSDNSCKSIINNNNNNNTNNNNSKSNNYISFDNLQLKCMCSDNDDDHQHTISGDEDEDDGDGDGNTGHRHPKRSVDDEDINCDNYDCKLREKQLNNLRNSLNNFMLNSESCDNLYNNKSRLGERRLNFNISSNSNNYNFSNNNNVRQKNNNMNKLETNQSKDVHNVLHLDSLINNRPNVSSNSSKPLKLSKSDDNCLRNREESSASDSASNLHAAVSANATASNSVSTNSDSVIAVASSSEATSTGTSADVTTATAADSATTATASTSAAGKRKKSPEKRLVLDLNDRSKYTEEVSV